MDIPLLGFLHLKVLLDGDIRQCPLQAPIISVFHVEHWVRITAASSDFGSVQYELLYGRSRSRGEVIAAPVAGTVALIGLPNLLLARSRYDVGVRQIGQVIKASSRGVTRRFYAGLLINQESIPSRHVRLSEAV